ncbi:hypothetical protein NHJ13051_008138 [Beauveria bassiana]
MDGPTRTTTTLSTFHSLPVSDEYTTSSHANLALIPSSSSRASSAAVNDQDAYAQLQPTVHTHGWKPETMQLTVLLALALALASVLLAALLETLAQKSAADGALCLVDAAADIPRLISFAHCTGRAFTRGTIVVFPRRPPTALSQAVPEPRLRHHLARPGLAGLYNAAVRSLTLFTIAVIGPLAGRRVDKLGPPTRSNTGRTCTAGPRSCRRPRPRQDELPRRPRLQRHGHCAAPGRVGRPVRSKGLAAGRTAWNTFLATRGSLFHNETGRATGLAADAAAGPTRASGHRGAAGAASPEAEFNSSAFQYLLGAGRLVANGHPVTQCVHWLPALADGGLCDGLLHREHRASTCPFAAADEQKERRLCPKGASSQRGTASWSTARFRRWSTVFLGFVAVLTLLLLLKVCRGSACMLSGGSRRSLQANGRAGAKQQRRGAFRMCSSRTGHMGDEELRLRLGGGGGGKAIRDQGSLAWLRFRTSSAKRRASSTWL